MIDFIPVSEYAHYFDVAVLCMVLTAVWQCHTGSVLKKETVSLKRHVGRIIYTNPESCIWGYVLSAFISETR